jgi:hypothetical protein
MQLESHRISETPGVTIAQRMRFLVREVGGAYCDDCLAKELKLRGRTQADRVARIVSASRNFCREKGYCSLCGAEKKVIKAV